jgi:hypothetical protein
LTGLGRCRTEDIEDSNGSGNNARRKGRALKRITSGLEMMVFDNVRNWITWRISCTDLSILRTVFKEWMRVQISVI